MSRSMNSPVILRVEAMPSATMTWGVFFIYFFSSMTPDQVAPTKSSDRNKITGLNAFFLYHEQSSCLC